MSLQQALEPTPYAWIDTRRYFTPPATATTYFTTEGVYGLASGGKTTFADPPSRAALMQAAFGAVSGSGIFGPAEMPHGITTLGASAYFVLHAPTPSARRSCKSSKTRRATQPASWSP